MTVRVLVNNHILLSASCSLLRYILLSEKAMKYPGYITLVA